MSAVTLHRWTASDEVELAWHETGAGRAVILLHGLFSDARMNWIKFGHAERIAASGFRVIMPDHRGHGESAKPHEAAAYGPGVLARDVGELIGHLGVSEFDLGGFSLGARTTVQAVGEGLRPGKAILGGMGLQGLEGWQRRKTFFVEVIDCFDSLQRGDPHWLAAQFMKSQGIDRVAARLLLDSFADVSFEWLDAFTMPTLVVCGVADHDNGSAAELAARLPRATAALVPGTHMSSVTEAAFGEAIASFLTAP